MNTIGIIIPELATMASDAPTVMVVTSTGWQVAHGIRTAQVGEVLQRPATQEELEAMRAKETYGEAAKAKHEANEADKAERKATKKAKRDERKAKEAERKADRDKRNAERDARKAKCAEQAEEAARRRKANPGDGSAFISSLVFEGKEIEDGAEAAMARCSQLDDEIASWEALVQSGLGWANAKDVLKVLRLERQDVLNFLANLKEVGNGLQKVWVKKYLGVRIRKHAGLKGISPKVRIAKKVKQKEHVDSFAVLTFSPTKVNASLLPLLMKAQTWRPYNGKSDTKKAKNARELKEAREALAKVIDRIKVEAKDGAPIRLNRKDGRITRLPETTLTQRLGIEAGNGVKDEMVVVHHGFEDLLGSVHNKVWADKEEDAERGRTAAVKALYRRLNVRGVIIGDAAYRFVSSSASHQKAEKAVFLMDELAKVHEEYLYFGHSLEEFAQTEIMGANFLKAMANRTRPMAAGLRKKDGTPVTVFDVLVVKDVKRIYHHNDALSIGGNWDNLPWKRGEVDNPVIVGDGQIMALTELNLYGQLNGEGWKGFCFDGSSTIEEICRRYNLTKEEVMDLQVEFFDGRKVRLGDYALLCGEGCWKFDKLFQSYAAYLDWIRRLMPVYPGIENLSILRQMDEEEDAYKRRRLTRSLIQQWIWMSNDEIDSLIRPALKSAKALKTMEGALRLLGGMDKKERDELEHLFEECPWLICAPGVQKYLKSRFGIQVKDAMANRLKTKGQYPYIIQDPVALFEIWVLGKDPNEDNLGILKAGEASIEGVNEDKEVLAVRFPANFLTARTLVNKPEKEAFGSCGNCCVLSIYDDILIRQDGDVDGDEMMVCYDELAIKLTKRMINEFDPPVVVFEHGSKAKAIAPGSVKEFWVTIADALYSAHHNGQVGTYANLARDCAYLMSIAYMNGDEQKVQQYLLWMAAASTGAILAIDQVKGNAISETLINWLADIKAKVRNEMAWKQPFTQQFLKKDIEEDDCLPPNADVLTDRIAVRFAEQVGPFQFDTQGFDWDVGAAISDLFEDRWQTFNVRRNVLADDIVMSLRNNYFNDTVMDDGTEMDAVFLDMVKAGREVGLKDILLFWWHNETAMKNRLESKFAEAQSDFYEHCRKCLLAFATGNKKPNGDGHVRTKAEEMTSLYNALVNEALELKKSNGVDDTDGTYTMFILKIIAPWVRTIRNRKHGDAVIVVPEPDATDWDWVPEEDDYDGQVWG